MRRLLRSAAAACVAAAAWAVGRRRVSAYLMTSGVACAVSGAYLQMGAGVALLVASALLIPLALLIGWE